jgi:hypothetical protein
VNYWAYKNAQNVCSAWTDFLEFLFSEAGFFWVVYIPRRQWAGEKIVIIGPIKMQTKNYSRVFYKIQKNGLC